MTLPEELLISLQNVKGFSRRSFEEIHASAEQVTSVRVNLFKPLVVGSELQLPEFTAHYLSQKTIPVPWCETGYYLSERPSFTLDPLFHAGCYYVQEASSMFLEQLVKTVYPDHATGEYRVLDLCAAPGGKTTHLSALFPEGMIVSNEVIKTRSGILAENVIKWGKENVTVTSNDAAHFEKLPGYFDMIVIDAPCSGSGMFRKDPDSIQEWSLQHVEHCCRRQHRIIEDIWPALKEGGILIYSTCSYSREENEDVLDWIGEKFDPESIRVNLSEGIVEAVSEKKYFYGYRFYPDKIKGEGLFMACIRKKNATGEPDVKEKKFSYISREGQKTVSLWLNEPRAFSFIAAAEEVILFPQKWMEDFAVLFSVLYVKKAGIKAGKLVRNELIPDHELAPSLVLSDNIPFIELDKEPALQYLRRNDIVIEGVRGWAVVRFKGHRLGWIKALPNRINNYYPKSLRILKH